MSKSNMSVAVPVDRLEKIRMAVPLLLDWFAEQARPLPWRGEKDPYRILVSEAMLQQTRIETVLSYYPRFIEHFPTLDSLALAREDEVLKCWEGLGYYSRARNLHKAAKICREEYGGSLPKRAAELKKLPGIGAYTAGAVASLAFGEAVPAVDGNVLRILARFYNDERDILLPLVKKEAEALLKQLLEETEEPGRLNEALMELGETVCLPGGRPRCQACPWQDYCRALACGTEQDLPQRGAQKARRKEKKTVLLLRWEDKIALEKRPDKGLLAGLYGFPVLTGQLEKGDLIPWLMSFEVPFTELKSAGEARHIFTHVEWEMYGWEVRTEGPLPGYIYAGRCELEDHYPLPSAFKAFRAMI